MASTENTEQFVSTLLGLFIVDDGFPILTMELLPLRPPGAVLRSDGTIILNRGFFLPDWAVNEIARVAECLRQKHREYVSEVCAAIQQEPTRSFESVPAGLIFTDSLFSMRIGPRPPKIEVDLSRSDAVRLKLKRYEIAVQNYLKNRYMLSLSDEQLGRRMQDIVGNTHVTDEQGRISLDAKDPWLYFWMDRISEIQMEMQLRHGQYPAGWDGLIEQATFPKSIPNAGSSSAFQLVLPNPKLDRFLIKYGERKYLEPFLRRGAFRLSAASSYNDPSLNPSIRDDELFAEVLYDPHIPLNKFPPGMTPGPRNRVSARSRFETDYYVYCLTDRLQNRLLLDFEGDACLLIRDSEEFMRRMQINVGMALPGWGCTANYVEYYDPLRVHPREIEIAWFKHFRYAYQHEVRLVWFPSKPIQKLEMKNIEIGSLEDIAELVLPIRA